MFALEEAEPDFDLIQPGRIGRQPMDLEVQLLFTDAFLFAEPAFELFGGVRGPIIEYEDHGMHLTTKRFGNDLLLHKSFEIDKAFALPTCSVDLAIGDREAGK